MKCPDCGARFSSDSQLALRDDGKAPQVPWFRLAPARRLECPECGTGLRYSGFSLAIVAVLGAGFLASMTLKIVFPEPVIIDFAFWFFLAAMTLGVPLLMHSAIPFARDES